jgi:hypothetical protein
MYVYVFGDGTAEESGSYLAEAGAGDWNHDYGLQGVSWDRGRSRRIRSVRDGDRERGYVYRYSGDAGNELFLCRLDDWVMRFNRIRLLGICLRVGEVERSGDGSYTVTGGSGDRRTDCGDGSGAIRRNLKVLRVGVVVTRRSVTREVRDVTSM